jgi:hypothetical protein
MPLCFAARYRNTKGLRLWIQLGRLLCVHEHLSLKLFELSNCPRCLYRRWAPREDQLPNGDECAVGNRDRSDVRNAHVGGMETSAVDEGCECLPCREGPKPLGGDVKGILVAVHGARQILIDRLQSLGCATALGATVGVALGRGFPMARTHRPTRTMGSGRRRGSATGMPSARPSATEPTS